MTTERREVLTTGEVSREFHVTPETVARWADADLIPCFRTPTGQRRFRRADIEALLAEQKPAASA